MSSQRDRLRDTLGRNGIAADAPSRATLGRTRALLQHSRSSQELPLVLRDEIGRGGMAAVWAAEETALGREVAVKRVVDPNDLEAQRGLLREAAVVAQLEHPNIVPIHQLLFDEHGPLVVMKRIAGRTWDVLIADPTVSLETHLDVFVQTTNALSFAHSRGVLHRDVKPENVMIGDYGEVYLLDWGVARHELDAPCDAIVGTPSYMAPEMAEGAADERTDVFLLGATLHEVLSGEPRHLGEGALDVLYAAMYVEPYAYASVVPSELAEICNRACARAPEARFATVAALREAVQRYREHRVANMLSDSAGELLAQLAAAIEGAAAHSYGEVQRLFSATRLAFDGALRVWPESPSATSGRRRCLELMIEFELAQRRLDAAEALIAMLSADELGLPARCEALRTELAREQQRLRAIVRDRDPNVGALGRTRAYLAMGGLTALMTLALFARRMLLPEQPLSSLRLTLVGAFVFAIMLAIAWLWRRYGDFNLINRRIAEISLASLAVSFCSRLSGHLTETSPERILTSDAFILGLGGLALVPYHRAGPWLVALSFGVAMVGSIYPPVIHDLFIALSVFVPAALLIMRREQRPGSSDGVEIESAAQLQAPGE